MKANQNKGSHLLRKGRYSQKGGIYFITLTTWQRHPKFTNFKLACSISRQLHQLPHLNWRQCTVLGRHARSFAPVVPSGGPGFEQSDATLQIPQRHHFEPRMRLIRKSLDEGLLRPCTAQTREHEGNLRIHHQQPGPCRLGPTPKQVPILERHLALIRLQERALLATHSNPPVGASLARDQPGSRGRLAPTKLPSVFRLLCSRHRSRSPLSSPGTVPRSVNRMPVRPPPLLR